MRTIIYNSIINDNKMYVFLRDFNMLCSINLLSNNIKVLGGIPGEKFFSPYLVGKMFVYEKELYLVPHNAKKAWKYNIESLKWSVWFELEECIINNKVIAGSEVQQKFNQAYLYGGKITLIGFRYPAIVIVDLKTAEILYDFTIYQELPSNNGIIDTYIRHDGYIYDEMVLLPCMKTNYILKYNLKKQMGCWMKLRNANNKYAGITYMNNRYYLSPYLNNEYAIWDGNDNFKLKKIGFNEEAVYFGAFCINNQVVFPGKDNTKTVVIMEDNTLRYENAYLYYDEVKDGTIIKQDMDGVIYITNEGKEFAIDFDIEREFFLYIDCIDMREGKNRLDIARENDGFDLQLYLNLIERSK